MVETRIITEITIVFSSTMTLSLEIFIVALALLLDSVLGANFKCLAH